MRKVDANEFMKKWVQAVDQIRAREDKDAYWQGELTGLEIAKYIINSLPEIKD